MAAGFDAGSRAGCGASGADWHAASASAAKPSIVFRILHFVPPRQKRTIEVPTSAPSLKPAYLRCRVLHIGFINNLSPITDLSESPPIGRKFHSHPRPDVGGAEGTGGLGIRTIDALWQAIGGICNLQQNAETTSLPQDMDSHEMKDDTLESPPSPVPTRGVRPRENDLTSFSGRSRGR